VTQTRRSSPVGAVGAAEHRVGAWRRDLLGRAEPALRGQRPSRARQLVGCCLLSPRHRPLHPPEKAWPGEARARGAGLSTDGGRRFAESICRRRSDAATADGAFGGEDFSTSLRPEAQCGGTQARPCDDDRPPHPRRDQAPRENRSSLRYLSGKNGDPWLSRRRDPSARGRCGPGIERRWLGASRRGLCDRAPCPDHDTLERPVKGATGSRAFVCDVADAASVERTFATVASELGPVEVLLYNADRVCGEASLT